MGFSLPWKFEPNPSWLSFWLIWGVLPPFSAKKSGIGFEGVKIFVTNFDHLLVLAYPENFSQIRVGWVFGWLWGVLPPFFAEKSGFGLGGVKFFVTNFDPGLVLVYPENLVWFCSVEAEILNFLRDGHGDGHGTHCDYIENLSPSFCLTWLGLALARAKAEVCQYYSS